MSPWESTVVDLFSEVKILETLISSRIERSRPMDLSDTQLSVLVMLSRTDGVGMARATMTWMTEPDAKDIEPDITSAVERGLVNERPLDDGGTHLNLTESGQATLQRAIQSLMPEFGPALEHIDAADLEQARATLSEIRRTLDNLPDR